MEHILSNIISFPAAAIFILTLMCFVGYGVNGYRERATVGFWWVLWFIGGLVGTIVWFKLVFFS